MSKTRNDIFSLSIMLAADTGEGILVDESGTIVGAEGNAIGPTLMAGKANDHVSVAALGVATCIAGAAIAKGDLLKAAADGKVVPAAADDAFGDQFYIGRALEAAAAADDEISVLLIPN